jgi:Immunity protein 10
MITQTEFEAAQVNSQEEDGILLVGFADDAGHYILLQRSLLPSTEDRKLGQDHVHIEMNDQHHSTYGGIKDYILSRDKLAIQFLPAAAQKIGSQLTLDIRFKITEDAFQNLKRKLSQVLAGEVSSVR